MRTEKATTKFHSPFLRRPRRRLRAMKVSRRLIGNLRSPRPTQPIPQNASVTMGEIAGRILETHSDELFAQALTVVEAARRERFPSAVVLGAPEDPCSNPEAPTYRDFVRQRKQRFIDRMFANTHLTELREVLNYQSEITQLRDYYGDDAFFAALAALRAQMLSHMLPMKAAHNPDGTPNIITDNVGSLSRFTNEAQGSMPDRSDQSTQAPSLEQEKEDGSY